MEYIVIDLWICTSISTRQHPGAFTSGTTYASMFVELPDVFYISQMHLAWIPETAMDDVSIQIVQPVLHHVCIQSCVHDVPYDITAVLHSDQLRSLSISPPAVFHKTLLPAHIHMENFICYLQQVCFSNSWWFIEGVHSANLMWSWKIMIFYLVQV